MIQNIVYPLVLYQIINEFDTSVKNKIEGAKT